MVLMRVLEVVDLRWMMKLGSEEGVRVPVMGRGRLIMRLHMDGQRLGI
jgi:hypothetical protein